MAKKQDIAIRVSGADVDNTSALASFTSDAIEIPQNTAWSLNVWFTSLAVTGQQPTVTIEVSNSSDSNSFNPLRNANFTAPRAVSKSDLEYRYLRVVYDPKGVTAGSKFFDLRLVLNG